MEKKNFTLFLITLVLCLVVVAFICAKCFQTYQGKHAELEEKAARLCKKLHTEADCNFVSSRGILKSCDIFPPNPVSSSHNMYKHNWSTMTPYKVVYVHGSAVPTFIIKTLPKISVPFVLVSGDCDESIPIDIMSSKQVLNFLNDSRLVHWFSQNAVLKHPKLSIIPIGLDYHTLSRGGMKSWGSKLSPCHQETMLNTIRNAAFPVAQRKLLCYSNFHFQINTKFGKDRVDAMYSIPEELVFYEKTPVLRQQSWQTQCEYAFVISPHGNGYDCHRTWEALILGCIPIMKKSAVATLFDGLPVLLVDDWGQVTLQLLQNTLQDVSTKTWNLEKLTLKYWMKKIRSVIENYCNPANSCSSFAVY
jgi:hypothetical protein